MKELEWTGERFLPEVDGDVQIEHMHRYAVARNYVRGKRVLDIACGEGYGSNLLASDATHVVGVDISPDAVFHAKNTYHRQNLEYILGECAAVPLKDASVDVVVSFETIEHHDQHEQFLKEIKRVLVPGGLLIMSSPDKKEYSDLTGHQNQYHLKELYLSEFESLLAAWFSHKVLLGQRIKYGSLIVPLTPEAGQNFISHKKDDKGFIHETKALFDPMYFLALASDGDIPDIFSSVYDHSVESYETVARISALLKESEENREAERNARHIAEDQYQKLREDSDLVKKQLESREQTIEEMQRSTSWRVTFPIRFVKGYTTRGLQGVRSRIKAVGGFRQLISKSVDIIRYRDTARLKDAFSRHVGGEPAAAGVVEYAVEKGAGLLNDILQGRERDPAYTEFREYPAVDTDIRLIAFYLPQYHPIRENDDTWGRGFTEWTNVSKAVPQYLGHYQPKLPGELGFYDLRLDEVHRRQIELAKNYGLHGFCYHYYWFDGKKVLDLPINRIMANPDMDFPFCINWANENWTKRWDGLDNDVILAQNHSPEDDLAFIREVEPMFRDPRYIRVQGKPLLMIYRPAAFPDIKRTVKVWRNHCRSCGIGEIYLVLSHAHEHMDPRSLGFDAATEFAPNTFQVKDISSTLQFFNQKFEGHVFDYCDAINYSMRMKNPDYIKFRSLCPGWDNESRKPGKGIIFHGASPGKYATWLDYLLHDVTSSDEGDNRLIFINAWNEWAEGACLEPDRKFGYAYLDQTYTCLKRFDRSRRAMLAQTQILEKTADIAVVLHLYYTDLWDEICESLNAFGNKNFDLYISINPDAEDHEIQKILHRFPKARIFAFENRGRDILPFMHLFQKMYPLGYRAVCKVHSKKSVHRKDGDRWRNQLFNGLLGSKEQVVANLKILEEDSQAGILVSKGNIFNYKDWVGSNGRSIREYARKTGIPFDADFTFPSGSMFWFKPAVFKQLCDTIDMSLFEVENGQLDGTLAHTVERVFGLLCRANGYTIKEVS